MVGGAIAGENPTHMAVRVEITDHDGFRSEAVDRERFWIGCDEQSEVRVRIPSCHSRVLEVRCDAQGLAIRVEPGLPFPVRSVNGGVGSRFEPLREGDVLNVGPALVKLSAESNGARAGAEELDLAAVARTAPGAPVGSWYGIFMEVADHL